MKCSDMIVTRGPFGSNAYSEEGFVESPSLTEIVVDRVGAGDAHFAMTVPLLSAGIERDLTYFIGNVAGALKVQTMGNKKPIEYSEMMKFINRLLK